MNKILIVLAHPNLETSIINKRWAEALKKHPEKFTVHELYAAYPDGHINVQKEQALIESHSGLILQFPLYWYNCTPLLKTWLDEVFTYGWAYGSTGNKLKDKKLALAVSVGGQFEEFVEPFTLAGILRPFERTAQYVKADYRGVFSLYGASNEPGRATLTSEQITQSANDYIQFLSHF